MAATCKTATFCSSFAVLAFLGFTVWKNASTCLLFDIIRYYDGWLKLLWSKFHGWWLPSLTSSFRACQPRTLHLLLFLRLVQIDLLEWEVLAVISVLKLLVLRNLTASSRVTILLYSHQLLWIVEGLYFLEFSPRFCGCSGNSWCLCVTLHYIH